MDYGIETVTIANLFSTEMRIFGHTKTILDRMQPMPNETSNSTLHDIDSDTDDKEIDFYVPCLYCPRVHYFLYLLLNRFIDNYFNI